MTERGNKMDAIKKSPFFKKRWLVLIVLLIVLNFFYLPYYFTKPGEAKVLSTVISVDGGFEEEGAFMLTTVRMGRANIINYLWARVSDSRELIHENLVRRTGETDKDYHQRQLMMMNSSQDHATIVAYTAAGKEARFKDLGVIVTGTVNGMSAEGMLQVGDMIHAVGDIETKNVESLLSVLGTKVAGESVPLKIIREEQEVEVTLTVEYFPEEVDPDQERVGIGITSPITKRELIVSPSITVDTNQIGGPSAGLMFSLEIYNQLVEEDITKGYQIAGTGSIREDGVVGRIGGVKQKVIAANRQGVQIFFVPNEKGTEGSNYREALRTADKINSKMMIVPVDTFEEALQYLENL